MEIKNKKPGSWENKTAAIGAAGATVAACAACCISLPLLGPVLAWLGITGLGALAAGWQVGIAAVAAGFTVIFAYRYRRRSMQRRRSCSCDSRS